MPNPITAELDYDSAIDAMARKLGEDKFHRYMGGAMQPSSPGDIMAAARTLHVVFAVAYADVREQLDDATQRYFEEARADQASRVR